MPPSVSVLESRPGRLSTFLEAIKFSHSVFALPFALISVLMAVGGWPRAKTLLWIVVACVAARTAAMCFNRIADREIDARNPRTAGRALVTGELDLGFAWKALGASVVAFFVAAAALNPLCLYLSPPVLAILLGYSLTKRFTHYTHFFLGGALGLAPMGAWAACTGRIELPAVLLGVAVCLWVAGFDILYSCQDYEVDSRDPGLHSLPKKLGIAGAIAFARKVHAAAIVAFLLTWAVSPFGVTWLIGVGLASWLIMHQHTIVSARDLSRINAAFFTTNAFVSVGLLVFAWLDVLRAG